MVLGLTSRPAIMTRACWSLRKLAVRALHGTRERSNAPVCELGEVVRLHSARHVPFFRRLKYR